LYARARRGEIKDFTGIDSPFESPVQPTIKLETHKRSIDECHAILVEEVLKRVKS
jgi:adenylylsulfate kinase-like enzyme